jgi:hypothetical protein
MTTPKLALRSEGARRELAAQQAALTATAADNRRNAWALEMLCRRNAVARWRGQRGCSLYEVMQTLDGLLA